MYRKHFSARQTPQSQPIPGRKADMAENYAGGYVFQVNDWTRLERFLILGCEGGTYYATEQELTVKNAEAVLRCLKVDGETTVAIIEEISRSRRAPKNSPALFALALASSPAFTDVETRRAAMDALPNVARTFSDLALFLENVKEFRGWGRTLSEGVAEWFNFKPVEKVAYQVAKYRNRYGWTPADVLRQAHPVPPTTEHDAVYAWAVDKHDGAGLPYIEGYEKAKQAATGKEVAAIIEEYHLTWEMVPAEWLGDAAIWDALLPYMPPWAMQRNLARMTTNGLLTPFSEATTFVCEELAGESGAKVHPISTLVALRTYQSGKGHRGSLTWEPIAKIVDALDSQFYNGFGEIEPTKKNTMIALDVSGSMGWSYPSSGRGQLPLSAREIAAAMCMVAVKTEPNHVVTIFSSGGTDFKSRGRSGVSMFDISPKERLDDVVRKTADLPFSGTDCALPMLYALDNKWPIDVFQVWTDNETWAGDIHPTQALTAFRQQINPRAKLVVAGITATDFSIADPNDAGQLDVVGFDTAVPNIIHDFVS